MITLMKSQGTFTSESIEQLYSSYAEKHGASDSYDENAQNFAEAYDFTTCERPDGSKYGTSGQCRKGKESSPGSEDRPKKPATQKQIASAEAKLAKLEEKSKAADFEARSAYQAIAGAGAGMARGPGMARAQAPARRRAERAADKASKATAAVIAQRKLVNEMKGIKEEAPKPAPKTPKDLRQDKLRKLETSINSRARAIAEKNGRESPQFKKFFDKYAPKLSKIQDELKKNAFS